MFAIKTVSRVLVVALSALVVSGSSAQAVDLPYRDLVVAEVVQADPQVDGKVLLTFKVDRGIGVPVGIFSTRGTLLVDPQTLQFTGKNELTARAGKIFIDIAGGLTPLFPQSNPRVFIIQVETQFTGGTGAYATARGGFSGVGLLELGRNGSFVGAKFIGYGQGVLSLGVVPNSN